MLLQRRLPLVRAFVASANRRPRYKAWPPPRAFGFKFPKMADLVEEVLKQAAEKAEKYKSVEVEKNLELEYDLGHLLAVDNNPIDLKAVRTKGNDYLKDLARDNTQLLINKIWQLPVDRCEDSVIAKLPAPTTLVPREKRIPQDALPTKWEQYAKAKGIVKRRKSKLVWDEALKEWKPRWGYRRGNDDTKDWLIEVKPTEDPYSDQFAKRNDAKKERVSKNELQRLRNIARAHKIKVPGVGVTPTDKPSKDQVRKAAVLAKSSTASLGKFQEKLPDEKPLKNSGKKRKFDPIVGNIGEEKKKNMAILDRIMAKQPKLDVEKAVNAQLNKEDKEKQQERKAGGKKAKGGKRKGDRSRGKRGGKKGGNFRDGKHQGGKGFGGKKKGRA